MRSVRASAYLLLGCSQPQDDLGEMPNRQGNRSRGICDTAPRGLRRTEASTSSSEIHCQSSQHVRCCSSDTVRRQHIKCSDSADTSSYHSTTTIPSLNPRSPHNPPNLSSTSPNTPRYSLRRSTLHQPLNLQPHHNPQHPILTSLPPIPRSLFLPDNLLNPPRLLPIQPTREFERTFGSLGTDIDSVSDVEDVEEVRERDHGDLVDAADGGGGGVEGEGPVGAVLGGEAGAGYEEGEGFCGHDCGDDGSGGCMLCVFRVIIIGVDDVKGPEA